jgi:ribosomal protein S18 acetylase RimI-like enzyme
MDLAIDRLSDLSSGDVAELLSDSEGLGSRIVRRLVDEWGSGANRFDRQGEALFGARGAGRLLGVCGLNVDSYAGDDRVGRVRHLYVLSESRRQGVGQRLVQRVIQAARGRFDDLRLHTSNPEAARLYEALGFRPCGERPDYTHVAKVAALILRASTDGGRP